MIRAGEPTTSMKEGKVSRINIKINLLEYSSCSYLYWINMSATASNGTIRRSTDSQIQ